MDAVEYIKAKSRMCKSYVNHCKGCWYDTNNRNCVTAEKENVEEAVAIVEQWAKEHPVKTYKDVLLEKIPKAILDNGVPRACKQPLFGGKCQPHYDCEKCWNEEYREE